MSARQEVCHGNVLVVNTGGNKDIKSLTFCSVLVQINSLSPNNDHSRIPEAIIGSTPIWHSFRSWGIKSLPLVTGSRPPSKQFTSPEGAHDVLKVLKEWLMEFHFLKSKCHPPHLWQTKSEDCSWTSKSYSLRLFVSTETRNYKCCRLSCWKQVEISPSLKKWNCVFFFHFWNNFSGLQNSVLSDGHELKANWRTLLAGAKKIAPENSGWARGGRAACGWRIH